MAQTTPLLKTLKKALKAHGLTYADVARSLELTEASVKRLFSEQSISLTRLDQICQIMGLEISDIVQMMNEQQPHLQQLTEAQEHEITQDTTLLLVTVCVLNKWSMKEITTHYRISEHECIQKLAQLDRLKIIELLPKNKIKIIVAPNFGWRENGPIQNFFQEKIGQEYFRSQFTGDDECLIVQNGMLSTQSNGELQRKLKRLTREFNDLNNEDANLPLDKRNGVTVVMAVRNWKFGLFQPLRK